MGLHVDALLAADIGSKLLSQSKVLNYMRAAGFQQGSKVTRVTTAQPGCIKLRSRCAYFAGTTKLAS